MRLLMIADDFTGALDAGVQFAKKGFKTRVMVYGNDGLGDTDSVEVLVVDAETRHRSAEEAYRIVYEIAKPAAEEGIEYLFKKTDSALRGNIGAELTALLDASGQQLVHFIPAFPRMQRITVGGIHYIDGVPVDQSVFGQDPFEPVLTADVPALIHQQCATSVETVSQGAILTEVSEKTIAVYDCSTEEEMEEIVSNLEKEPSFRLIAGCAGCAEIVPRILGRKEKICEDPILPEHFLVICGSVNPITVRQLDYAQTHGFVRIQLTPEQKLTEGYFDTDGGIAFLEKIWNICMQNKKIIIDTNDLTGSNATEEYARNRGISLEEVRLRIADTLGEIVESMVSRGLHSSMMMTGGDTLFSCIQLLEDAKLTPVGEFEPGIVLSELVARKNKTHVFTKSGGFGEETLLTDMAKIICKEE